MSATETAPRTYTLREAAERLGTTIHTLRRMIYGREIAFIQRRPRGPIQITEQACQEWQARNTTPARVTKSRRSAR